MAVVGGWEGVEKRNHGTARINLNYLEKWSVQRDVKASDRASDHVRCWCRRVAWAVCPPI